MKQLSIKICGLRDGANIKQIANLSPDFMGFIFYEQSPRNACGMPREALCNLPSHISSVAVFVNEQIERAVEIARKYSMSHIQLHGDEPPEYCRKLKGLGFQVMKAISVDTETRFDALAQYEQCIDMFVFDAKTPGRGGSGQKFEWNILDRYTLGTKFLLSGGITANDAPNIKALHHPMLAGVDLNSRFETSPGIKDTLVLSSFINQLRNTNQQ